MEQLIQTTWLYGNQALIHHDKISPYCSYSLLTCFVYSLSTHPKIAYKQWLTSFSLCIYNTIHLLLLQSHYDAACPILA